MEENCRLKTRLHAAEAEAGQRQASSAEQDYEEVIQLLEAEIRDLKNQLATKRQARGLESTQVSPEHFTHAICSNFLTLPRQTFSAMMFDTCYIDLRLCGKESGGTGCLPSCYFTVALCQISETNML